MRIQHNIPAMNAYRNYNANASALNKNLEKLSSGYKINRAGDNAAGLAISEKMRAQITGLEQAQSNVKDGISLVKTAEGALTEVHDMLNRMEELATQSANGTYDNEVDRSNLQKEVEALKTEINRIADSANFNGINLLDGSLGLSATAVSELTTNEYQVAAESPAFGVNFGNAREDAVATQSNASFTVSLDDIAISSGTTAADNHTFSLIVGGTAIEIDGTTTGKIAGDATAANIATALVQNGFALDNADATNNTLDTTTPGAHVEIQGNIYEMTATNNKITFTQVNTMKPTDSVVNPDFKVSFVATPAAGGSQTGKINTQVQVTSTGIPKGAAEQATATLSVDFTKLQDGDKMTVADKTYVFKVGEKSTTTADTGNGEVLVDLHEIFESDADLMDKDLQNKAMVKLTEVMKDNSAWSAGNAGVSKNVGSITLQSLSTYTDGASDVNGTTIDIKMDTEENIMKQFISERPSADANTSFKLDVTKIKTGDIITIGDKTYEFTNGATASTVGNVAVNLSSVNIADGIKKEDTGSVLTALQNAVNTDCFIGTNTPKYTTTVDQDTGTVTISANDWGATSDISENKESVKVKADNGLVLQIGDTADEFNRLKVKIEDMHADALGIGNLDISNQESAATAIDTIKDAINSVSSTRGTLGATQNRLEHTQNNLSVMTENIQDAESAIRDTDVAAEMMEYTKNNILLQSAQAMLAQSNQLPQGVLQLLG